MQFPYAKRMANMNASDVRELLKLTANKNIIGLGGGLPAPELFPIENIKRANEATLDEMGADALQYTTTEGYTPLREWICARMNKTLGTSYETDQVVLMSGSQQALDFAGKVFLDPGDVVLCESPTYLSALGAFRAYECNFVEVPTDSQGMIISELEKALAENPKVRFIYVIPTFQNPTGVTWTLERRKGLVEAAKKYNVLVIEDNPYGELRFEGEPMPAIASMYENVLH
ncbi:PLP-dependent aminotransferase family protein, partial [Christensenellaceae bacterium OttesenSCG-928-L17]|nr:PLP-dependent aminotransferase family protein [Christensenellaceae bacterium OttesenSCG-928-L17]